MTQKSLVQIHQIDKNNIYFQEKISSNNHVKSTYSVDYTGIINILNGDAIEKGVGANINIFGARGKIDIIQNPSTKTVTVDLGLGLVAGGDVNITFDYAGNVIDYKGFIGLNVGLEAGAKFGVINLAAGVKYALGVFIDKTNANDYAESLGVNIGLGIIDASAEFYNTGQFDTLPNPIDVIQSNNKNATRYNNDGTKSDVIYKDSNNTVAKDAINNLTTNGNKTKSFIGVNNDGTETKYVAVGKDQSNFKTEVEKVIGVNKSELNRLDVELGDGITLDANGKVVLNQAVSSGRIKNASIGNGTGRTLVIRKDDIDKLSNDGVLPQIAAAQVSYVVQGDTNDTILYINETAEMVISGVTYLAGNVVQAGEIAYNALYDYVSGNSTAGSALVSASIDGAMYETLGKIGAMFVSGQRPTALDMIKMFAQTLGYKFASNVVTETDMGRALSLWIDSQIGISGYGGAVGISHANDNALFSYRKSA